jgi:hypothetical protein
MRGPREKIGQGVRITNRSHSELSGECTDLLNIIPPWHAPNLSSQHALWRESEHLYTLRLTISFSAPNFQWQLIFCLKLCASNTQDNLYGSHSTTDCALLLTSCPYFAYITIRSWKWRRYIPPKLREFYRNFNSEDRTVPDSEFFPILTKLYLRLTQ